MSYSFSTDLQDGYLHVRVKGENTPATIRRYLSDTLNACISSSCPNVLIEEDLAGPRLSIVDIFSIIEEKSGAFRPAMRLVAFVDVRATSPANMKFAENAAVNRGVTAGMFDSVPDAQKWLRKKLALP